jgi:hypothetical protein
MSGREISLQLRSTATNWLAHHPQKFNAAIKSALVSYYPPSKLNKSPVKDVLTAINEGHYQPLIDLLNKKKSIFRWPNARKIKLADQILLQLFKNPELTIVAAKQFYPQAQQVRVSFDSASSHIQLSPFMSTLGRDGHEFEVSFKPIEVNSQLLLNVMISDRLHPHKAMREQDELAVVPSRMATFSEKTSKSSEVILKSILRQPSSMHNVAYTKDKPAKAKHVTFFSTEITPSMAFKECLLRSRQILQDNPQDKHLRALFSSATKANNLFESSKNRLKRGSSQRLKIYLKAKAQIAILEQYTWRHYSDEPLQLAKEQLQKYGKDDKLQALIHFAEQSPENYHQVVDQLCTRAEALVILHESSQYFEGWFMPPILSMVENTVDDRQLLFIISELADVLKHKPPGAFEFPHSDSYTPMEAPDNTATDTIAEQWAAELESITDILDVHIKKYYDPVTFEPKFVTSASSDEEEKDERAASVSKSRSSRPF